MQSFSSDREEDLVEDIKDKGDNKEKLNEMSKRNISNCSSELESYENED